MKRSETEFFSSVTSLQEDTEGGMLYRRESKREIYYWLRFYKVKEKVYSPGAEEGSQFRGAIIS